MQFVDANLFPAFALSVMYKFCRCQIDLDMFRVAKPRRWAEMPLFKKVQYYKTVLTADYAPYVDKLTAKELATRLCPEIRTARVVRILAGPDDLQETDANAGHLLKSVHGSGWNIHLVAPLNLTEARAKLHSWMKTYSVKEKQYIHILPRFFIEEILDDAYTGLSGRAYVFMIRCIHGVPVSVRVRKDNGVQKFHNSYSPKFELLEPVEFPFEQPPPHQWDALLRCATQLSAPFEFVRIDLYIGADGHIYLSEFTFTPANGAQVFSTAVEAAQGQLWT